MTTDTLPMTSCSPAGGRRVVNLQGELDIAAVDRIEAELAALAGSGTAELVLDLSDVTFCDTSGVNLFLRLQRRCTAARARLRLQAVPGGPGRVLRLLGVHQVIPCTFL